MSIKKIKYDTLREKGVMTKVPVAANQNFFARYGKYVKLDGSKRADIAASGDGELVGWAMIGNKDITTSATAGGTRISIDCRTNVLHEIPIDETKTAAQLALLLGETCDLAVDGSGYQTADVGESNEDVIQIMGYDVERQTVFTRLNPNKLAATGVV